MDRKVRILFADSNAPQSMQCMNHLKAKQDIEIVSVAGDGLAAWKELERRQVDVLVMDLVLPKLDGFGILERLAASRDQNKPDIMVLTALSQESVIRRACEMGAKYYMIKPFDAETLYQRILDLQNTQVTLRPTVLAETGQQRGRSMSRDEKITGVFLTIGIPAHIKGYHYLREAVKTVMDDGDIINRITKELYPTVAKRFSATPSKVERAIRHAIEVAWARGRIENINSIFGYNIYNKNDKPTNGEFIALIADKLKLDQSA
jgi:two-component system response regulator (stage 0 sporulation protein A)